MARRSASATGGSSSGGSNPFRRRRDGPDPAIVASEVHVYGNHVRCVTDTRGFPTPQNRGPLELVVDSSEGFVPLWDQNVTLRWRFNKLSFASFFEKPAAAQAAVESLLGAALVGWGDAVPVKLAKRSDAWDFEVVMMPSDDCDANGCVLAQAFFPDAGRHKLRIWPKMFEQDRQEQIETLQHELGHAFGLRHFFASLSEAQWPSQVFGTHSRFTIMNYGGDSRLTADDRSDLKNLYALARSGQLTEINGTPIKLLQPFHTLGPM